MLGTRTGSVVSAVFQGLVNSKGEVYRTDDPPNGNTLILRGIAVNPVSASGKAVHFSITAPIHHHVAGVPVAENGVVCCLDVATAPNTFIPGGSAVRQDRLYVSPGADPTLIHQGVGLRDSNGNGRICTIPDSLL